MTVSDFVYGRLGNAFAIFILILGIFIGSSVTGAGFLGLGAIIVTVILAGRLFDSDWSALVAVLTIFFGVGFFLSFVSIYLFSIGPWFK